MFRQRIIYMSKLLIVRVHDTVEQNLNTSPFHFSCTLYNYLGRPVALQLLNATTLGVQTFVSSENSLNFFEFWPNLRKCMVAKKLFFLDLRMFHDIEWDSFILLLVHARKNYENSLIHESFCLRKRSFGSFARIYVEKFVKVSARETFCSRNFAHLKKGLINQRIYYIFHVLNNLNIRKN